MTSSAESQEVLALRLSGESLADMDNTRQDVTREMASLHPDVEVTVLFRSAPAK